MASISATQAQTTRPLQQPPPRSANPQPGRHTSPAEYRIRQLQELSDQTAATRALNSLASAGPSSSFQIVPVRPAPALRTSATVGPVAQRVGGQKFGLEAVDPGENADAAEGLEALKAARTAYKAAVKLVKDNAIATFQAGDQADIARQAAYTQALANAEMTPAGLIARLPGDFTHAAGTISYKGHPVAHIREGAAAYAQSTAAISPAHSAIYKRHTLDGLSDKDYVRFGGRYLRRTAHRGITPPERAAYKAGNALTPMNAGNETVGSTGYNFDASTGAATAREEAEDGPTRNDLAWLNEKSRLALGAVPNDPTLLSFMQTRKGVGKIFSGTSTDKSITSNHGAEFTGYGKIDIDLAQVPEASVAHHYKMDGFTGAGISGALPGARRGGDALDWEADRANESVLRNREILLSSIPHAAVSALHDTPAREAYETEFCRLYRAEFKRRYVERLNQDHINAGNAPEPPEYPYIEDHFTQMQARRDSTTINQRARTAADTAADARRDYCEAYIAAYNRAWKEAYEDAAWGAPFAAVADPSSIDSVDVPEPPTINDATIPPGAGAAAANSPGDVAGQAAGAIAGAAHVF